VRSRVAPANLLSSYFSKLTRRSRSFISSPFTCQPERVRTITRTCTRAPFFSALGPFPDETVQRRFHPPREKLLEECCRQWHVNWCLIKSILTNRYCATATRSCLFITAAVRVRKLPLPLVWNLFTKSISIDHINTRDSRGMKGNLRERVRKVNKERVYVYTIHRVHRGKRTTAVAR
jgi:hypothetical protein